MSSKFKYSILTFIIGKNYEVVHEVVRPQDDVEYVLVTDDPELVSHTWKVVCDETLSRFQTAFEKCFYVRYNPFKYCSSEICVTIDGSMQVKGSLDKLISEFNQNAFDICLMPHPLWADLLTEYSAWVKMRNYPIKQAQQAIQFLQQQMHYDFQYKGLFQLCFTIKRKNKLTANIDQLVWQMLQALSRKHGTFDRLDQTIYSAVVNQFFSDIKVLAVSAQVVRSYAIQWYWHNSNNPNMNIFYDINKPDEKFVFNVKQVCYYLQ